MKITLIITAKHCNRVIISQLVVHKLNSIITLLKYQTIITLKVTITIIELVSHLMLSEMSLSSILKKITILTIKETTEEIKSSLNFELIVLNKRSQYFEVK